MNAVVNRLLATKKAPQGAFFTPMGEIYIIFQNFKKEKRNHEEVF